MWPEQEGKWLLDLTGNPFIKNMLFIKIETIKNCSVTYAYLKSNYDIPRTSQFFNLIPVFGW